MRYEFHPGALAEYDEAAHLYRDQQADFALSFIICVEDAIAAMLEDPMRYRRIDLDARRRLTSVFPYAVIYTIEDGYVLIVAVAHCSREPSCWRARLT